MYITIPTTEVVATSAVKLSLLHLYCVIEQSGQSELLNGRGVNFMMRMRPNHPIENDE